MTLLIVLKTVWKHQAFSL